MKRAIQWTSNGKTAKVKAVPFSFKKVRRSASLFLLLIQAAIGGR